MKRLAIAIAIALIGTRAFAADMAVKAPPPAPAPVYNWTGWYAGVNAGGSFGNVKTDFNIAPITVGTSTIPGFASSNTEHPSGFMGGGQVGYNWQFSPIWVVGLEADFQGALEKDSNNLSTPFNANVTFLINLDCIGDLSEAIAEGFRRVDNAEGLPARLNGAVLLRGHV